MDEREAVARLKAGDIGGLEVLVYVYYVKAVRAAYLITREESQAEDVVQAAFLRVYERIGQFDERRPFGPWFLRGVTNAAVRAVERQRRHAPWPEADEDEVGAGRGVLTDAAPLPEELVLHAETRQEIWAALDRLPLAQRAAIVRRYYLDLSEDEMASETGCPPGTVKWRLHTARKRLRAMLSPL